MIVGLLFDNGEMRQFSKTSNVCAHVEGVTKNIDYEAAHFHETLFATKVCIDIPIEECNDELISEIHTYDLAAVAFFNSQLSLEQPVRLLYVPCPDSLLIKNPWENIYITNDILHIEIVEGVVALEHAPNDHVVADTLSFANISHTLLS